MKEEEKNPFLSDRTTTPPLHCLFIFNPAASQFMFPESNFQALPPPLTSPRAFCADRRIFFSPPFLLMLVLVLVLVLPSLPLA